MKEPNLAPWYAVVYPWLCEVCRANGYALAVHGSVARDLDLIAIPWTDQAVEAEELIESVRKEVDGCHITDFEEKPHGRRAWSVCFPGGEAVVDFGVMPKSCEQ